MPYIYFHVRTWLLNIYKNARYGEAVNITKGQRDMSKPQYAHHALEMHGMHYN